MLIRFTEDASSNRKGDTLDAADWVCQQWIDAGVAVAEHRTKQIAKPPRDKAIKTGQLMSK